MKRNCLRLCLSLVWFLLPSFGFGAPSSMQGEQIAPGIWHFTFGAPEKITPVRERHYAIATDALAQLPKVETCPVTVSGAPSSRGCLVHVALEPNELIYGLGLQLQSFQQRGSKKTLRVNANPAGDAGDSHAPVPFYVTTRGYGVLIDTARYATFYLGDQAQKPRAAEEAKAGSKSAEVLVEVPRAPGVDVYVFAGPAMRQAVQRYNLFAGGGALPPRWGLGFWYRCEQAFDQTNVLQMASELRSEQMPCDVLGLEPGWQSHSYSCSFVWSSKFPDPRSMFAQLQQDHYRVNLWEHAFTHHSSPIYPQLLTHSGDYEVWGGLVPDFLDAKGARIFADFQEKEHVALGASGYKLDECDNSDFTGGWSFPELSRFPSGADGEQMHSLFGLHYQDTIQGIFDRRMQRTYGLVRNSGALAAPYPYVLYSDLYDHRQFVRAVAEEGFTGLLWTPEVREAANPEELLRRLESTVFSPLTMINAWYLRNPPWKQVDRDLNNAGHFAENWQHVEAQCRDLLELRMKFVPYLHAAFVRYHREGLPPFRALVMDYPNDSQAQTNDDEYMVGDNVLVAPVIVEGTNLNDTTHGSTRSVYLPAGEWYDFWTGARQMGGQRINVTVPIERIPIFVKAGTILPLAQPTLSTDDPASWKLTAQVFGDGNRPATLYEDDGNFHPSLTEVRLQWDAAKHAGQLARSGPKQKQEYEVSDWKAVP